MNKIDPKQTAFYNIEMVAFASIELRTELADFINARVVQRECHVRKFAVDTEVLNIAVGNSRQLAR